MPRVRSQLVMYRYHNPVVRIKERSVRARMRARYTGTFTSGILANDCSISADGYS